MGRARRQSSYFYVLILASLIALAGYVVRDAIYGTHGLVAREQLDGKISALRQELSSLQEQRKRLEQDAQLLTSKANEQPALLDAEARSLLDLARPSDIIIVNEGPSN